jgi:hypothetical protein
MTALAGGAKTFEEDIMYSEILHRIEALEELIQAIRGYL